MYIVSTKNHIYLYTKKKGGGVELFPVAIANGFVVGILFPILTYGVTLYPMRLFNKYSHQRPVMRNTRSVSDEESNSQTENWVTVISRDIEILHKFMRFLVRSFCVENMLFIIEVMQCKQEFIKRNGDKISDYLNVNKSMGVELEPPEMSISTSHSLSSGASKIDYGVIIQLYGFEEEQKLESNIPRSTIVYGDNNYTLNQQMKMIYDKYIAEEAALQINIPFDTRNTLKHVIMGEDVDDQVLIQSFDDAINEIRMLLSGSFIRFKAGGNINVAMEDIESDKDRQDVNEQIIIAMQRETSSK